MTTYDPVSLGILWDRLISITDEIVSTLVRTSFSINVRESYDLSCVLFDAEGNPIAQGSYSVPSFTGTSGPTIQHMFRKFPPDTLQEGDVVATNDPWMGTGHLYDISVMRPVFHRGRRVGFTMSITHLPDIGGAGNSAGLSEIYEEGLRLPVVKLMNGGKLNTELMDIIRTNVRVNEQVIGDIMANISCNEVGGRLLAEFMEEYRIDDLGPLSKAIRDQSERVIRDKIAKIPDGRYTNAIQIEGIKDPITLACEIVKRGETVAVDFSGTGDCVRAAINVPFCYTRAWAAYSIKCLTCPETPNNEGQVRPIAITAPENCILNAQPPWPTAGRHSVGHFVVPLMFGALAEALPHVIQADPGMMNIFNVQGKHRDGRDVASLFFLAGGFGAHDGLDGAATTPAPSNMGVVPTEVWENLTSMTVVRRELLADSGGPGKFRGGVGQEVVLRNDTGNLLTVSFMGLRTQFPAVGFHGGKPGALRHYMIDGKEAHPKGRYVLSPGATVVIREAGGGGFGAPRDRARDAIEDDIRKGLVTVEGAKRDYGYDATSKVETRPRRAS
jgi:N-methylhydantoinase B